MWGNHSQGEVWDRMSPARSVPTKAAAKIYIFPFALWFRVDINPCNAAREPLVCRPCAGMKAGGGGHVTLRNADSSFRITPPLEASFLDFWDLLENVSPLIRHNYSVHNVQTILKAKRVISIKIYFNHTNYTYMYMVKFSRILQGRQNNTQAQFPRDSC